MSKNMNLRWAPLGMRFNFHITRTIREQSESASVCQGGTSPSTFITGQKRFQLKLAYISTRIFKDFWNLEFCQNVFESLGVYVPANANANGKASQQQGREALAAGPCVRPGAFVSAAPRDHLAV